MSGFRVEMSRLLDVKPRTIVVSVVGGALAYVAYFYIRKALENRPPKKWRKVGEISDLLCYPIKSCGWIRLNEFECNQIGVQSGNMRDRTFMIVNKDGEFVTARAHPKLVKVVPKFEGDVMTLSAPGMILLSVDIGRLLKASTIKATVWGQLVDAVDAGEEAARWFSRYLFQDDFGLRLVFYPQSFPTRDVREVNKSFTTTISSDTGALHDATSFMMINESSIADLNTRVKNAVTPLHFRPNFVLKGPTAYEEDKWKWVKVGDVVFRNVKPCTRCIFTTIDPETGIKDADQEPLKTLRGYRMFKSAGTSPVMGIHLGLRQQGKVKMGDAVYVEDDGAQK